MRLSIKPQIVENRYSVIVSFKEFGSSTLTAEMEQKIIGDYAPKFKLSDLSFNGKYKVDDSTGRLIADDSDGEEVTLSIPNREVAINQDLELGYTVHIKEIAKSEIKGVLKDADKVAQAKVQLFIDVITKKIGETLIALGEKINDFEEEYDIELG